MNENRSSNHQGSPVATRGTVGALAAPVVALLLSSGFPAVGQSVRQVTDIRTESFAGYAIDDRGTAVWAVISADPFGANPEHEYQVVSWSGAGAGSQATTIGGLGSSVSVSDGGQWIAFISRGDPLGQNADRSLELFLQSADGATILQLTHDPGPWAGRVQRAVLSGSGNRVVFVSNSDLLGTNPNRVDQLYVVDADGTGLGQLFVATAAASFGGLAISDDGERIVFAYTGNPTGANPDGISQVFRVEADGFGLYQYSAATEPSVEPAISGAGSLVVYRTGTGLRKVNWDTSGAGALVVGSGPSINDAATRIYYSATDGGNQEIFWISPAGGAPTQVTFTDSPARNAAPVASGSDARVVFTDRSRLMSIDADGGQVEQLLDVAGSQESWLPDITPDGSRIAFLGGSDGTYDLYRVQRDGSDRVQLTSGAEAWSPSISGDGETIVFMSWLDLTGENCLNSTIYAIAADGSALRRLSGCNDICDHPAIARDGSVVVFQCSSRLRAVSPAGGVPTLVIDDGSSFRKNLRVTHDGAWVVYQSDSDITGGNPGHGVQIFRARTDGSFVEQITNDPSFFSSFRPDVSGDGGRIVYASYWDPLGTNPEHNREIFLYEPATAATRQLTATTDGVNEEPRISGDGRYVYFQSTSSSLQPVPGHPVDLFRLRIATGEIERAGGVPDPRGWVPPWSLRNPANFAVDHVGGAVFGFAFNSDFRNPDLNVELFRVDFDSPPRIEVGAGDPTVLRWDADPAATTYDAIRGDVGSVGPGADGTIDLGPVVCLIDDSGAPYAEDDEQPSPGQAFFYLGRAGSSGWGSASGGAERVAGSGDCLP